VTNLSGADLHEADLSNAVVGWTVFSGNNLRTVKGLESVKHMGPSTLGLDTLQLTDGKIPAAFLRGVGVAEDVITKIPLLIQSVQPIPFHSCFISYNHQDE